MKYLNVLSTAMAALAVTACATGEATMFGEPIRQYADGVVGFSTEYNDSPGSWSASRALGPENVYPSHGDLADAWASWTADNQREYLVLSFDTAQTVTMIEIYETYNPGAVDRVYLRNVDNEWTEVYAGQAAVPETEEEARIFTIAVDPPVYRVNRIRIELDSEEIPGWNEIDAVAITGRFPIIRDE